MPQYSFQNIGAQKTQPDAPMSVQQLPQVSQMDIATATIASQSSMSGGKIQYTQAQQTPSQIPSVTLTPQIMQLLATAGLLTQQPNQLNPLIQQQQQPTSVPQTFPTGVQQMQTDQQAPSAQIELLKQYLQIAVSNQQLQAGTQAVSNPVITNNDPNMQAQNQEMASLGSFDQNLLQSILQGDSPMVSFESFEGLSGNVNELNYDPNIAGFETVGADTGIQNSQQQLDETAAAVQNLNG